MDTTTPEVERRSPAATLRPAPRIPGPCQSLRHTAGAARDRGAVGSPPGTCATPSATPSRQKIASNPARRGSSCSAPATAAARARSAARASRPWRRASGPGLRAAPRKTTRPLPTMRGRLPNASERPVPPGRSATPCSARGLGLSRSSMRTRTRLRRWPASSEKILTASSGSFPSQRWPSPSSGCAQVCFARSAAAAPSAAVAARAGEFGLHLSAAPAPAAAAAGWPNADRA
mmetsp:Transcript_33303/g.88504  ORF Transcript_33303/g.88504 Transcript_33303/m.88504 type:complete len:232 (-) Transcript_33303:187-882(-)